MGTHLQIGYMKLVVIAQIMLLAGEVVHRVEGLLARLVARRRYNPIFGHHFDS